MFCLRCIVLSSKMGPNHITIGPSDPRVGHALADADTGSSRASTGPGKPI